MDALRFEGQRAVIRTVMGAEGKKKRGEEPKWDLIKP